MVTIITNIIAQAFKIVEKLFMYCTSQVREYLESEEGEEDMEITFRGKPSEIAKEILSHEILGKSVRTAMLWNMDKDLDKVEKTSLLAVRGIGKMMKDTFMKEIIVEIAER